jgi:hypothetical protein
MKNMHRWILLYFGLFSCLIYFVFQTKYQVISLEKNYKMLNRQIQEAKESIHILKAEWEYLNHPNRLIRLAQTYLPNWHPIQSSHIVSLSQIPKVLQTPPRTSGLERDLEELLSE